MPTPVMSLRLPQGVLDAMPAPRTVYAREAVVDRLIADGYMDPVEKEEALNTIGVFLGSKTTS